MHRVKFAQRDNPLGKIDLNSLRTFWEFDNAITAPLHGFKDASEYYKIASSRQYLHAITIPTLILHARDDPFTPLESLPTSSDVSHKVTLKYTDHGGHVGFIAAKTFGQLDYWLERAILDYLTQRENPTNLQ